MPPARTPMEPAKAAPASPDPGPPASEPKAKAPDLQPQAPRTSRTRDPATTDGRRSEPTRDAKRSSAGGRNKTGNGPTTATAVDDPPAVARSPTADAATSRYRFSLRFDNPALRQEAQQIAVQYGMPLAHIIRAVGAAVRAKAKDFREPAVAAWRLGSCRPDAGHRTGRFMAQEERSAGCVGGQRRAPPGCDRGHRAGRAPKAAGT